MFDTTVVLGSNCATFFVCDSTRPGLRQLMNVDVMRVTACKRTGRATLLRCGGQRDGAWEATRKWTSSGSDTITHQLTNLSQINLCLHVLGQSLSATSATASLRLCLFD